MPSFKPKTNKQLFVDEIRSATLDSKHNDILERFHVVENETIPTLQEKVENLKESLKTRGLSIDNRLDIRDEITRIQKEIKLLKKRRKIICFKIQN